MRGSGHAHGKLILMGEHAAIYGSPAVGVPLPYQTSVTFLPTTPPPSDGKDPLQTLLKMAAKLGFPTKLDKGIWQVKSDVPWGCGFGSSAALCLALAHAILNTESYNQNAHWLANQLEKTFHGNPSGIDTGLAGCSQLTVFYPMLPIQDNIPRPQAVRYPPLHLIYGALQRKTSTKDSIKAIKKQPQRSKVLYEIKRNTIDFIQALQNHSFNDIVTLINQSQHLLSQLGISSPQLDMLFDLAFQNGAVAAKLSGAGNGGAFFLLSKDENDQKRLLKNLSKILEEKGINLIVGLTGINLDPCD